MAKFATSKAGNILHPTLVTGYLRERNGVWYCSYRNNLRSTGIRAGKDTITAAMQFLERFAETINSPEKARRTLEDVLPEYLSQIKGNVSLRQYKAVVKMLFAYMPYSHDITDYAAIRAMIIARRIEQEHAASTYNKAVAMVAAFFKWAIGGGYCAVNPCDAILRQPLPPPRNTAPTAAEITAICDCLLSGFWYSRYPAEREHVVAGIRLLATSGLRIMEMLKLTDKDVLPDGLRIDGKRSRHDAPRVRYLPYALIPTLQEQVDALNKGGKLFRYNTRNVIARMMDNTTQKLGLPHYSPHDLRRYAVRRWEREFNYPPHIVNLLAGHSFAVRQSYHNAPTAAEIVAMMPKI